MKLVKIAFLSTFALVVSGCGESTPAPATTEEAYKANLPDEVRAEEERLEKKTQDIQAKLKAKADAKAAKGK